MEKNLIFSDKNETVVATMHIGLCDTLHRSDVMDRNHCIVRWETFRVLASLSLQYTSNEAANEKRVL